MWIKFLRKHIIGVIVALIAVIIVVSLWKYFVSSPAGSDKRVYTMQPATLESIREMIRLCTADVDQDVTIKATVDGKGIFAVSAMTARVYFDLDSMRVLGVSGDTVFVFLPEPQIEILESTAPGSYRVLDTWDERNRLFPRRMTAIQEDAVKRHFASRFLEDIRRRGIPDQARRDAVDLLSGLGVIVLSDTIVQGSLRTLDR